MDHHTGVETSMTIDPLIRMALDRESDMREIARTENFLAGGSKSLPSWYAHMMTGLGDKLVVYGTRLKAHYSARQVYPVN